MTTQPGSGGGWKGVVVGAVIYLVATAAFTAAANVRSENPSAVTRFARWACNVSGETDAPYPSQWCWLPFGEGNNGYPSPPRDPYAPDPDFRPGE